MEKLNKHQKGYLKPSFQMAVIRSLRSYSEKELRIFGNDGDYPEEILASWIYAQVLTPLGW